MASGTFAILVRFVGMGTAEQNKSLYTRFCEQALNRKNYAAIDELVDTAVVSHSALPGQRPGAQGLKDTFSLFHAAFPDLHAGIEDLIAEGDRVVARCVVTGTHRGEFMGQKPTGASIRYDEIVIVRFDGGRIVEHWSVADSMALMSALRGEEKISG